VAGPSLPTILLARLPCSFRRGAFPDKGSTPERYVQARVVFYINLTRVDKLNSSVRKNRSRCDIFIAFIGPAQMD